MAEPIRNYTPKRVAREEAAPRLEAAPIKHANAVLAAYDLLQQAHDHGVLDTLRGAIGGGQAIVGKLSEYGDTPEGIRLMRNLLLAVRLLGQLDPALLESIEKAIAEDRDRRQKSVEPPTLWSIVQLLTGENTRRALGTFAGMLDAFGSSRHSDRAEQEMTERSPRGRLALAGISAFGVAAAAFLIGRMSASSAGEPS